MLGEAATPLRTGGDRRNVSTEASIQQSAISPERLGKFQVTGWAAIFHECRTISKAMICGKTIRLGRRSKHARDSALRPTCGALTRDRTGNA